MFPPVVLFIAPTLVTITVALALPKDCDRITVYKAHKMRDLRNVTGSSRLRNAEIFTFVGRF
jgi:hypothetical protein